MFSAPLPEPFVGRVFSRPPTKDSSESASSAPDVKEDEMRRKALGAVFSAPFASEHSHLAESLASPKDTDGNKFEQTRPSACVSENEANYECPSESLSSQEASTESKGGGNDISQGERLHLSDSDLVVQVEDNSDAEWEQPAGFYYLKDLQVEDIEASDNDTRSSAGLTDFSPLRPRRLYETALLNKARQAGSSLRESALWSDGEDTGDLSTVADVNDLSQYHADLEDELDGTDEDYDTDSSCEYSSACSTLAESDESGDEDFFDAESDSGDSEGSVRVF